MFAPAQGTGTHPPPLALLRLSAGRQRHRLPCSFSRLDQQSRGGHAFAFGLPLVSAIIFVVGSLFAFIAASSFADMKIWAFADLILAAMAFFAWRSARKAKTTPSGVAPK
jgi:hypothetical protein